jgi:hypothetical protein
MLTYLPPKADPVINHAHIFTSYGRLLKMVPNTTGR